MYFRILDADRRERQIPIADFKTLMKEEQIDRVRSITRLQQELIQVGFRAYPDYQPLLAEYGFVLASIVKNELEGVSGRLEKLAKERKVMVETAERTRDVLDWYSLSTARELRGDFTGYQRLLNQLKREKKGGREKPHFQLLEERGRYDDASQCKACREF